LFPRSGPLVLCFFFFHCHFFFFGIPLLSPLISPSLSCCVEKGWGSNLLPPKPPPPMCLPFSTFPSCFPPQTVDLKPHCFTIVCVVYTFPTFHRLTLTKSFPPVPKTVPLPMCGCTNNPLFPPSPFLFPALKFSTFSFYNLLVSSRRPPPTLFLPSSSHPSKVTRSPHKKKTPIGGSQFSPSHMWVQDNFFVSSLFLPGPVCLTTHFHPPPFVGVAFPPPSPSILNLFFRVDRFLFKTTCQTKIFGWIDALCAPPPPKTLEGVSGFFFFFLYSVTDSAFAPFTPDFVGPLPLPPPFLCFSF